MKTLGRKVVPVLLLISSGLTTAGGCSAGEVDKRENLNRGQVLFFQGQYEEALGVWAQIKEDFPYSFLMDKWRARAFLMLDQAGSALTLLQPYFEVIPEHPELLMLLGMCRLQMGDTEQAFSLLDAGSRRLSEAAGIYLIQADAFYRFGLSSRAALAKKRAQLLLSLDTLEPSP